MIRRKGMFPHTAWVLFFHAHAGGSESHNYATMWLTMTSRDRQTYYYNTKTGESSWSYPRTSTHHRTSTRSMYDAVALNEIIATTGKSGGGDRTMTGIRKTNNWIKRILIEKYCQENASVLDLCCGKGGDLLKYKNRHIRSYVGVDFSGESLRAAMDRASPIISFQHRFIEHDLRTSAVNLDHAVHLVSAQFCLHYFFESEATLRMFMSTAARNLTPGGHFVATFTDAAVLRGLLKMDAERPNTNTLYDLQRVDGDAEDTSISPYGSKYVFSCGTTITNSVEYMVDTQELARVASSYGLKIVEGGNFHEFLYWESVRDSNRCIHARMSRKEWEVVNLYRMTVFKKIEE